MNKKLAGGHLHDLLSELFASKNEPIISVQSKMFRVQLTCNKQEQPYLEGFHFSTPCDNLGRYNDPTGSLPVCYVADLATTALAEVYGRRDAGNGERLVQIDRKDFISRSVSVVEPTRPLRLFDLSKALIPLGLTLSEITSKDYSVTQSLVAFFAAHPELDVDGIAYISTHYVSEYCYALWLNKRDEVLLKTCSITSLQDFESSEVPRGWDESTIDAEEILTQVLRFSIPGCMD
ncbi:RES family NAD+ phosphorylase [Aeromonas sp. 96A]|uniref:RES family NAD+ phosphorylase n=1 Tax=Aeromonas sp. 96A TaxID=3452730 RepID=UPI003F78F236